MTVREFKYKAKAQPPLGELYKVITIYKSGDIHHALYAWLEEAVDAYARAIGELMDHPDMVDKVQLRRRDTLLCETLRRGAPSSA